MAKNSDSTTCLNGLAFTELKNNYSESLFFETVLPSEKIK